MILRGFERKPRQAILSCLGITMALAIFVMGSFSEDAIAFLKNFEFFERRRQDMEVSFFEALPTRSLNEISQLSGVLSTEPFRRISVRIRAAHRSRRLTLIGLPNNSQLFRPIDKNLKAFYLPDHGIALSEKLAEVLGVQKGDGVRLEMLEGDQSTHRVRVSEIVAEYLGLAAYVEKLFLHRLLKESPVNSGVSLKVDSHQIRQVSQKLKNRPQVASVQIKKSALQSFEKTIADNLLTMRLFNIIFASIITFGVVYNNIKITLSERSRELATLRVVGMTVREISMILIGEIVVIVLLALIPGLGLGYALAALTTLGLQTETYQFPLVVHPTTYGSAVLVVLMATFLSVIWVQRRLQHLDLIAVLKSRE